MKQAYVAVRAQQAHKRDAILAGVEKLGYELVTHPDKLRLESDALYITWNLHGQGDQTDKVKETGGTVVVVENPYISRDVDGQAKEGSHPALTFPI